jgi:predicted dehydrogenase
MTVRIGLLGSGFVSNFYLLGLQDVSGWTIPVVASPNAEHARRFAQKWNIAESTSDVLGVIDRTDLDLIVLGVPNHFHMDLATRCAKAGKHVVCTKPLARNRLEARAMLQAVRAAGVLHGYAETEVFSPAVMKAKKYIDQGGIGKVLTMRSREAHGGPHEDWFWKKDLAGGGALLDMGCHTIESARYFMAGHTHYRFSRIPSPRRISSRNAGSREAT